VKVEKCANCNQIIGKFETACLYKDEVICQKCDARLRGQPTNEPVGSGQVAAGSNAQTVKHVRRHSIFYYVFWGTVSLFVTLMILFIGFVFLTNAGYAYLSSLKEKARNHQVNHPAVRYLPLLNEHEIQMAKNMISELEVKKDAVEGTIYTTS
jgi:hypothetical protein